MNTLQDAYRAVSCLKNNIETVIQGKSKEIDFVLTCLLGGGHILLEDNPGTGKTVLAKTLAACLSNSEQAFKRIQFTPDLLPMDLLGTHIYNEVTRDFEFRKGPLFTHILLADEINRASPKVQSALLECMAEHQITIGEKTYPLSDIFFTIATQNPIEMEGTYPLPAAQLDRFYMKISLGYVDAATELNILKQYNHIQSVSKPEGVISLDELRTCRSWSEQVFVHDNLLQAILWMIRTSRNHPEILLGASTRAGIAFVRCVKAYAFLQQRDFVTEEDILQIAVPVLHHRCMYAKGSDSRLVIEKLVNDAIRLIPRG